MVAHIGCKKTESLQFGKVQTTIGSLEIKKILEVLAGMVFQAVENQPDHKMRPSGRIQQADGILRLTLI